MGAAPRISVVIPCYNAAATIEDTIESVQAQTEGDWEMFVVDDGSSDATADVVRSIAERDDRITLLSQSNSGVAAARNAGIARSTAPLIGFVDADDYWFPTFLEEMADVFDRRSDVGVLFSRAEIRDPQGHPTGAVSTFSTDPIDLDQLILTNPAATCSTLMVRTATFDDVGCFATELLRCEDQHWMIKAHLGGWSIEGLDRILVGYRTSPGGLSADLDGMLESWEAMVDLLGKETLGDSVETARAEHLMYLARRALRLRRHPRVVLDYLRRAVRADARVPLRKMGAVPSALLRRVRSDAHAGAGVHSDPGPDRAESRPTVDGERAAA